MARPEAPLADLVGGAAEFRKGYATVEVAAEVMREPPAVTPQADDADGKDEDVGSRIDDAYGQEIGRASGRERVCQYVEIAVVAVSIKKKKTTRRIETPTTPKKN